MERISLITTGGTIDKDYGRGKGVRDLCINKPVAFRLLSRMELDSFVTFRLRSVLAKDSLDITDEDRQVIVRACVSADTSKIIVTHGTDTMKETAEALSKSIQSDRTVVLTGALIPASMYETDAQLNLGLALGICLLAPPGVYIAMNGIHQWQSCAKNLETGVFEPL